MNTPLEQKAWAAVQQYSLFRQGDRIAIGVSGGADSVALLRFLAARREENQWDLVVCHIHHGLRGEEADRDERFVGALAEHLGLSYAVRHIDAARLALEDHISVEEAGRNARYAFLAETAGEGGYIATAHTLDDTIETVLMNLIRGTGLHGLCGIPRTRGNIIRPLLDVTRAEVEEYLARLGQPYCTDSTNLTDDYTRNRIRHEILPQLRTLNPNFSGAMARMLSQLTAQWEMTETLANEAAQQLQGACGSLSRQGLLALPQPICDRL
ncbi:MAG TPA: tRNA lysidine(34) synthetase TilS, partial [Ruminococcaceae bacterium]|nr:tRNA lysidine(34) synthetase TilS [Oscillospiraceae bacterium]